jgi:hypothetical protein
VFRLDEKAPNKGRAAQEAKALGLEYYGFGRYGKDRQVTHMVAVGDNLVAVSKPHEAEVNTKARREANKEVSQKTAGNERYNKAQSVQGTFDLEELHAKQKKAFLELNKKRWGFDDAAAKNFPIKLTSNEEDEDYDWEYDKNKLYVGTALEYYRSYGYKKINEFLTGVKDQKIVDRSTIAKINLLDELMKHTELPHDMILYRGVHRFRALEKLKVGGVLENSSFISTSIDPMVAANFNSEHVFVIRVHKGTKGFYMNAFNAFDHADEHEVLLPRNTRFRVIRIEERETKSAYGSSRKSYRYIVETVPEESKPEEIVPK